ncbi:hypothetical protein BKA65DRAFT_479519 [Rhexocercosporidium sp. MPI-PUGE-AT-0058]|nr:hypothetical protein BKA65DRAFT_479519 [Rhexocercosporidium sp. MPI-PUGE-AT-0058]
MLDEPRIQSLASVLPCFCAPLVAPTVDFAGVLDRYVSLYHRYHEAELEILLELASRHEVDMTTEKSDSGPVDQFLGQVEVETECSIDGFLSSIFARYSVLEDEGILFGLLALPVLTFVGRTATVRMSRRRDI